MLVVHGLPPGGRLELDAGATAGDVLHCLQLSPAHQRAVTIFINDQRARPATLLKEGDRVFLGLPMSGG